MSSRSNALHRLILPHGVRPKASLLEGLELRRLFAGLLPVADAGDMYDVDEGQTVFISGLASTDADGQIASYQWDTNYNPVRGFRSRFAGPTWRFTADDSGSRQIALRVVDNEGNVSAVSTATINIADVAPTISLTAPNNVLEGSAFQISWTHSDPGRSDVVNAWTVDWGDDTTSNLPGSANTAGHVYAEDGAYTITLTSTQTDAVTTLTHQIVVANNLPVVQAHTPQADIVEGDVVTLEFTSPNRQSTLEAWLIEWGDGEIDYLPAATARATHVYADDGQYTAIVRALEPDGASGSTTVQFAVANAVPTATITGAPVTAAEGDAITLGSTISDPGTNDTHTYGWSVFRNGTRLTLPNGTDAASQVFTFTPTDNGNYVVRLTVVDSDGGSYTTGGTSIAVTNVAPTAGITGSPAGPIDEGTPVTLTANVSDAGTEDTFTYAWRVYRESQLITLPTAVSVTGASLTFAPPDNGTYVVTVTVTDDDGAAVTVSGTAFVVNNVAPTANITGAPANANEGDTLQLTAGALDAGSADTFTYAWSVTKDGQPYPLHASVVTNQAAFAFVPNDNGSYVVNVTVTDDDGDSVVASTAAIAVANVAPTAVYTGMFAGSEGAMLHYAVAAADAGSADTFTYAWSVTKNGQPFTLPNGHDVASATFSFVPDNEGVYVVSIVVQDDDGASRTYSQTVQVANVAPAPVIVDVPATVVEGQTITVGSSVSDPGAADTFTYAWSVEKDGVAYTLPGGHDVTSPEFTFTAADNGAYRIRLAVTDDGGATGVTFTNAINVANVDPVVAIGGEPQSAEEGDTISLSTIVTDPGADTHTYAWSVTRNGQAYATGSAVDAATLSFVARDNGVYVATVVVRDEDGGETAQVSQPIVVTNVDPIATLHDVPTESVSENMPVRLHVTASDAGIDDVHSYQWSVTKDGQPFALPAGATVDQAEFVFTPTDEGLYAVTVIVGDGDGGLSTVTSDGITVVNAAPAPTISGVAESNEASPVTFTARPNDPGSLDTHTYSWSVTRNGIAYVLPGDVVTDADTFTFTPGEPGNYVVGVTVTDNGGLSGSDEHGLTVQNIPPVVTLSGQPTGEHAEGQEIAIAASANDVSGQTDFTYAWVVTRNGTPYTLPNEVVTDSAELRFVPTDDGKYVVTAIVTDAHGGATTVSTSQINVANIAPQAIIVGAPVGVSQSELVRLESAVTDASSVDSDNGFVYEWKIFFDGASVATGTEAALEFTPHQPGVYSALLKVTDKDGGTTTTTATEIEVTNAAPTTVAIGGLPQGMNESETVVLTASASDAPGDAITYAWSVKRNGSLFAQASGPEFAFSPHSRGNFEITLTATDSHGASTSVTESIAVANLAPTGEVTAPAAAVLLGNVATFGLAIDDVPPTQAMEVTWNFGDGQTRTANYTGDQAGISVQHTYVEAGTYTVTAYVSDGVDTTVLTSQVVISRAGLKADPFDSGKTALYVLGTSANDTIRVDAQSGGRYKVTLNGTVLGSDFAPTGRTVIKGDGGDNTVIVTGNIDALVFAGNGNNAVITGAGNDTIVGGAGGDYIEGGIGRDVLIGMGGADQLRGGDGEDLLIASTPRWANDVGELAALAAAWNADQSLATRVATLKNSTLFSANAITHDTVQAKLYGEARGDWFVLHSATDRLFDFVQNIDLAN